MNRTDFAMNLLNIPMIGRGRTKNILKNYSPLADPVQLINYFYPFLSIGEKEYRIAELTTKKQKYKADLSGIKILSHIDFFYPSLLLSIKDYPPVLYMRGNHAILNKPLAAALIGSRMCSEKLLKLTELIGEQLSFNGFTIISGLALGCDTRAHESAIKRKTDTIAVMPCGPDFIYPRENRILYSQILRNKGVILSEYGPGTHPAPYRFVERDRLQSGLANLVVLIEASVTGGAMYAAYSALKQKRPLLVFQPETESSHNSGNRLLILQEKVYPFSSLEEFILLMKNIGQIISDCNRDTDQLIFPYV
ncbi:MAG: DNA-protecting protein DprA [Spirochaetaceae bacterium]|nr:DNA-protecting protein DprA [Spirochaetaceae bacterium]